VFQQAGYATAFFGAGNPYISKRFGYSYGFDTFRDFLIGDPTVGTDTGPGTPASGWLSGLNRKLQDIRPHLGSFGSAYDELYFQYCERRTKPPKSLDELRRFPAAHVIVDQAQSWLASLGGGPFFLWLHLMDPHSPYYPVDNALEQMDQPPLTPIHARYLNSFWRRSNLSPKRFARHREEVISLYDAGIRWVDMQMAILVDTLCRLGIWERCVFALTADHGEEFLDHGGRYHPPARLMDELIRVPLLLRVPGARDAGGRETNRSPFSLLHLAPTLLDIAAVKSPSSFRGHSHWDSVREGIETSEVAISESIADCTNPLRPQDRLGARALAIRESGFKLTLDFASGSQSLYDLEHDPAEQRPLAGDAEKPARRRLLERAREHLQESAVARDQVARVRSKLRDLRLDSLRPGPSFLDRSFA
jgi:arylsulfatase A-like enzyme